MNISWCLKAKELLNSINIKFHVVELDKFEDGEGLKIFEELKTMTEQRTVPNIFIDGNCD